MKNALVILSDPRSGSEESVTRLVNALAFADECKRFGDELAIVFAGTGTRWPAELAQLAHPAHAFYQGVREHVVGASRACAMRNQAVEGLAAAGVPLLADNALPGTAGAASIRGLHVGGWTVTVF